MWTPNLKHYTRPQIAGLYVPSMTESTALGLIWRVGGLSKNYLQRQESPKLIKRNSAAARSLTPLDPHLQTFHAGVLVKGFRFRLSYHNQETVVFTIDPLLWQLYFVPKQEPRYTFGTLLKTVGLKTGNCSKT